MSKRHCAVFNVAVLTLFLAWPGFGAQQVEPKARLRGFSEFITKAMAEWKVPGMAIAIVKDGKVVLSEGFGLRNVKNSLKVTPRTVFAIGSVSKAFTATTAGILADEGKLDWDKPIREYLPTFQLWDDFASQRMTARDLLSHRSGLPRHDAMWNGSPMSRQELYDRLRFLEPSHDFRAVFQYQNLMFVTAGCLVGALSHSTWEEFARKRIFEPLGMTSSSFSIEDMKVAPDHALPYRENKDKVVELPFQNVDAIGPAGSINSNVVDMANWVILNLNRGKFAGRTVVSEAALSQMHSPQMVIRDSALLRHFDFPELFAPCYGLGWFITSYRGRTTLFHGGNIGGFSSIVSFMPGDNTGLVILTNLSGTLLPYAAMFDIYDRLLGLDQTAWSRRYREITDMRKAEGEKAKKEAGKDRRPGTKPSHPLDDYVGEYTHPGYGAFSVTKDGESLKAKFNGRDFAMIHYHFDVFDIMDAQEPDGLAIKATFGMAVKGNIIDISVKLEPVVKEIVFARRPEKK